MKKLFMIVFVALLSFGCQKKIYAAEKHYSEYTIHQLESMSFDSWWKVFKRYAKERGERISEWDRKYYEINYFRKFYLPHEAFEEEHED